MKGRVITAAAALGALAVAGCGSSGGGTSSSGAGTAAKACVASIGFEGPITGPVAVLGTEQLHFAELARVDGQQGEQDQDLASSRATPSSSPRRPRR